MSMQISQIESSVVPVGGSVVVDPARVDEDGVRVEEPL